LKKRATVERVVVHRGRLPLESEVVAIRVDVQA